MCNYLAVKIGIELSKSFREHIIMTVLVKEIAMNKTT